MKEGSEKVVARHPTARAKHVERALSPIVFVIVFSWFKENDAWGRCVVLVPVWRWAFQNIVTWYQTRKHLLVYTPHKVYVSRGLTLFHSLFFSVLCCGSVHLNFSLQKICLLERFAANRKITRLSTVLVQAKNSTDGVYFRYFDAAKLV